MKKAFPFSVVEVFFFFFLKTQVKQEGRLDFKDHTFLPLTVLLLLILQSDYPPV